MALVFVEHTYHCIFETFDSMANSLAASAALLADDLSEHENIDLPHALVVIDSLDLANFVLDDHLSDFLVSATDNLCCKPFFLLVMSAFSL